MRDQNISLKQNIVLRDEEGQLWAATICFTTQNRVSITAGWSKFYEGHKLREEMTNVILSLFLKREMYADSLMSK